LLHLREMNKSEKSMRQPRPRWRERVSRRAQIDVRLIYAATHNAFISICVRSVRSYTLKLVNPHSRKTLLTATLPTG
jgi:hypothetical protein